MVPIFLMRTPPSAAAVLARYFADPEDPAILGVWADALLQEGDPRGEYIQLCALACPSAAQSKRRSMLENTLGGALVGPAVPFLREWKLGPDGLVERASCEADKLVEGIEAIVHLNPRLALAVTSVKRVGVVEALAAVPLGRIHYVDFTGKVLGVSGPSQLSDRFLRRLAPSLRGVKNLGLSCIGNNSFSPAALRELGDAHDGLEFFAMLHDRSDALLEEYVDVITTSRGFRSLRGLFLPLADAARIRRKLPKLVKLEVWERDDVFPDPPDTGRGVEAFKAGLASPRA